MRIFHRWTVISYIAIWYEPAELQASDISLRSSATKLERERLCSMKKCFTDFDAMDLELLSKLKLPYKISTRHNNELWTRGGRWWWGLQWAQFPKFDSLPLISRFLFYFIKALYYVGMKIVIHGSSKDFYLISAAEGISKLEHQYNLIVLYSSVPSGFMEYYVQ